MLVWINGPFGGGKTQTAHELCRRLPATWLADPEHIGFAMHRLLPPGRRGDFQDLPAWRSAVVDVLDRADDGDRVVVVPMTVVEPAYFAETVGALRARDHDVRHFALLASRETVRRRLRERGLGHVVARAAHGTRLRQESFAAANLDRCLAQLREPLFAEHLHTDEINIAQVAERIAASAGLALRPNTDSPLRGWARRSWVGVRHLRLT